MTKFSGVSRALSCVLSSLSVYQLASFEKRRRKKWNLGKQSSFGAGSMEQQQKCGLGLPPEGTKLQSDLNDCQKWATEMPLCADGMGKSKRDVHPLSGHFCHFCLFHKCLWILRTAVLLSCEPKAYRLQAPGFRWKEFPNEEPSIANFFCGSLPVNNYLNIYVCVHIFIHTYLVLDHT